MNNKTSWVSKILSLIVLLTVGAAAHAIPTGTYELGNHPDGNAQDPLYGFRLDG